MKHLATVTLMLTFGVAAAYADEKPVKMNFSGTSGNSAITLQQSNTTTSEDDFAGNGTLGSFAFRDERAVPNSPTAPPPSSCSAANQLYLTETLGAGVFRFHDGNLLYLTLTHGEDCIDLTTNSAHCLVTFKITGGTGRFKDASGELTMTETVVGVLSDQLFFADTGEFRGTVSGIREEQGQGEEQ